MSDSYEVLKAQKKEILARQKAEPELMLDWIEQNRPQICKVRSSECEGDLVEIDTKDGTWRGKTLRKALRSAMKAFPVMVCIAAIMGFAGCHAKTERWPASPAEQFGVKNGMICSDGFGPTTIEWTARYERDGAYWCYEKDKPR